MNSAVPPVAFAITTPAGGTTPDSTTVIKGTGWVDLAEIRLTASGQSLAITWTSKNAWSVTVPVQPGANTISLSAYDREGLLIGTSTVAVTGTGTSAPASASNLAVSEVMYHPAPSTAAEITAGFADEEQFEFVELVNTSATLTVDLTGAAFTDGIAVTLPATTVPAGGRIVIPRNPAAFAFRYGAGISTGAGFGTSTSPALSNSGETLLLKAADGQTISTFTYSDTAPWPEDADGAGYSLTAIRPGKTDPAAVASWRTSAALGGTPGKDDRIPLSTWLAGFSLTDANSDSDADGLPALIEYTAGYSPIVAGPGAPVSIQTVLENDAIFPVVSFVQKIGTDDADLTAEVSTELAAWSASQPDRVRYLGRKNNDDATETVRFQSATPISPAGPRQFLRFRASTVP
ncbi:MAG: lamin tail domain-containing protein [Verrucomicrobiota bacterium]